MNWQSKTTSEVNKEKIWAELVKKEHRDLKIFDNYRTSPLAYIGKATTAPVSEREQRFLDKSQLMFESSIQLALPELRQASSSHGRYALPLRNMQFRATSLTSPTSPGNVLSPTTALPASIDDELVLIPRSISSTPKHGPSSNDEVVGNVLLMKSSGDKRNSSSPFYRPTSAAEIGSILSPLVKHRVSPFRYSIPKTDIRGAPTN